MHAQRPHTMAAWQRHSVLHGGQAQVSSTPLQTCLGTQAGAGWAAQRGWCWIGPWWLAGCHLVLYIDEQDTSAFKRCKISWSRALLAATIFQGLNGKLIPEWAMSLCSHVRGSSGYPVVLAWSGAARGVRGLALLRVINHTKSTFHSTVGPPTPA